jgi:Outer membrane protein beta-barrel domain
MRKLLLATTLALVAGAAQADELGLYAGAGITQSQIDNVFDAGPKINDTAWKAIFGFRPPGPFAIEANYLDLGSQTQQFSGLGRTHTDAKAFAAYAVGFLPIPVPMLDVYGKLGAARWQLDGHSTNPDLFAISDRGTNFAWGAGSQAHFGRIAVRLEYEQFDMRNTDGVRIYTLGATYTFL